MLEAASRRKNQPAPPHIICEALQNPDLDPSRPWLKLLDDEVRPEVLLVDAPHLLLWSSLWTRLPDAQVRFNLLHHAPDGGTDLRWTLLVAEAVPDPPLLRHIRTRLNVLINANFRDTLGQ